ncbi:MAG: mechanosensitive ion channel family protein [Candidatus Diapherotrites archaeon]
MVEAFFEWFFTEYLQFVLVLIAIGVFAVFFRVLFKKFAHRLLLGFGVDIPYPVLKRIAKPLYFIIITVGFYFAVHVLSLSEQQSQWAGAVAFVACTILFAVFFSRFSTLLIEYWLKASKGLSRTPKLLEKVVSLIVYLLALSAIFIYFKIETTPVIAALGLSGLAVGLALQSTLSNLFAGINIVSDRPINVGDFIELEGQDIAGYVEDIGWRSTRLRTFNNDFIVVPNSKLADSIIKNHTAPGQSLSLYFRFSVPLDSDLEKVERVTTDVARHIQRTIPGAVKTFEPFIRFKQFNEYGVPVLVVMKMETYVDQYPLTHEFIKELKKRFKKEKLELSLPSMRLYSVGKNRAPKSRK